MAYFVTILTSDSTRSYVMQSTLPTKGMRSIISTVSISLEGFLPSILLLVVTVVIVAVILVVVIVAIVGVVIVVMIIRVFVIVTIIRAVVFFFVVTRRIDRVPEPNVTLSSSATANAKKPIHLFFQSCSNTISNQLPDGSLSHIRGYNGKFLEFRTSRDRYEDNRMSDPIGGLEFLGSSGTGSLPSGRVDLTGDENPTDEDGDIEIGDSTEVSVSFGDEIFSKGLGKMFPGKVVASSLFRKCSGTEDIDGKRKVVIVKDSKVEECWRVLRPRLRMKQQGDDVASWWPRNGLKMLVRCLGAEVGESLRSLGAWLVLNGLNRREKGYRITFYNKRTRLIVESIHLQFDEIKEMSETSVANDTSGLVTQRQKASDYDNSGPVPQLQNVSPSADTIVPSQQELDLLFSPLYDEFFNTGTSRVNKSSSPTNNLAQQDTQPSTNIHHTTEPSTPTNFHAEENIDNQAEDTQVQQD
ncbi:hypothetical protein Tco_0093511 [Tanacetum coccineum]